MNQQSKEQLCDSNNTNSNQVSTQAPNNLQINEEKPFYLTNQQGAQLEELNIKQSISNNSGFHCNKISLFFLCKGIINALTFAFSLIFLGIFQEKDKSEVDHAAALLGIGAIGSLICVIIFILFIVKCTLEPLTCYILTGLLAVCWILFAGCVSIKMNGSIHLTLAIIMSSAFINCIISMKWKHYFKSSAFRLLGDIVVIGIGCLLFIAFGGKFKDESNVYFLVCWVIMRVIVFIMLAKQFDNEKDISFAVFIMEYYGFIVVLIFIFILIILMVETDMISFFILGVEIGTEMNKIN